MKPFIKPPLLAITLGVFIGAIGPAHAGSEQLLYPFAGGSDGESPLSSLLEVDGTLYGTTSAGGLANGGTVFSLNPVTGVETVLYSFGGTSLDGIDPRAGLIDVNGTLYGTTRVGGALNRGTVFAVNPTSGSETVVYSFGSVNINSDGIQPAAGLINVNGTLYGTTSGGGGIIVQRQCSVGCGTVFSLNPVTGAEAVVYAFKGNGDGIGPQSPLLNVGGTLYGTTAGGGAFKNGTVFAVNPATGAEKLLHSFKHIPDGATPVAGLIAVNGYLFGTTDYGGSAGDGTVYAIKPSTGAEKVIYSFQGGTDSQNPVGGLIDVGGLLYGTTSGGSSNTFGTVFSVNPMTGVESVVFPFTFATGYAPQDGMIDVGGILYGTAYAGGPNAVAGQNGCCGTVFAVTP